MNKNKQFVIWFKDLTIKDVPLAGGKNASLGEMYRNLAKKGINVPDGFAVTAYAYRYLLDKAKIKNRIKKILSGLNTKNIRNLAKIGKEIREIILKAEFPKELENSIKDAYKNLCKKYGKNADVAVRSSATAEDLPDASFAGQQETFLDVRGEKNLIKACKKCFASLFTNRAISYREDKKFSHFKIALSIGIEKMVRSDLACSGVMFSIDTETGFKDVVLINGSYGLGENIVQGRVNPDQFYVFKQTLKKGFNAVISKQLGTKKLKMIYSKRGIKNVKTSNQERKKFVLSNDEIMKLANWACTIEEHYKKPMDIEWAKDGKTRKLFIVQARPETVQSQKDKSVLEEYILQGKGNAIISGLSIGDKIGQGTANVIKNVHDINKFKKGQVLVTDMTDPDWEPIMKIASAIVTNRGGRTCFTGDTILLTNRGFLKFEDVFENYEGLYVPSLNKKTLKVEWRKIISTMKRKSDVIEISTSQTGRVKNNTLRLTADHKILTFQNRNLVPKEIKDVLYDREMLTLVQKIPSLNESSEKDRRLAYLLGAISTDGHIHLTKRRGGVYFIQKPTAEKENFIATMQDYMKDVFGKSFSVYKKKESSKQIAIQLLEQKQNLAATMLSADEELIFNFLAGIIDGDGTYNYNSNKINIFCSNESLLQTIVLGCLRLGIAPQVTTNRNIYNIQIVERVIDLFKYTKRVKGTFNRKIQGTRFFAAKQLLNDIINTVNYKGRIKPYVDSNLLIDFNKIKKNILPLCSENLKESFVRILDSDLRMQRVKFNKNLREQEVYNITVEGNHNYVVFTDRYTPILVNNCHAAIVTRELGIPCVVGTNNGTEKIKTNQKITVSCAEGEEGFVYNGLLKFKIRKTNLKNLKKPKTKIMMNVGNPEQAFEFSFIPNDGVGLAREEFIINEYIKIHPLALLNFSKLKDKKIKKQIEELTFNYKNKADFFVDKLSQGIAIIGSAFYPKDVIVRASDFKSNEYANLIGGKEFEPKEDNPMIGWRGASRYYSENYRKAFALECRAFKKVRDEMGLTNIKIMVPFCRTIEEGKKVLREMEKNGLKQGKNALEVYVMCEIPSNVVLADEFSKIFDGFSIGTNDLTQLTLGLDRDSELVSDIYDERNEAVKKLVGLVIHKAKKNNRKIGICGEAASLPEFAKFLVHCGIDSVSVNADSVIKTTLVILDEERKVRKKH